MTLASTAAPRRSRSLAVLRLLLLSVVVLSAGVHTAAAQTTETYESYTPNTHPSPPVTFGDFTYDADGGQVDVTQYGSLGTQAMYWDFANAAAFEAATSAPAPTFELHGFRAFGWDMGNFQIEGRRNGSVVHSATVDGYGTTSGGVSFDGYADGILFDGSLTFTGWTDIDEVRMYSGDNPYFELEVDDLTVTWAPAIDTDGSVTASGGVSEPVGISTTTDTVGEALDIFDFTITDGGTGDGLALDVSEVVLNASGTTTDAERGKLTLRLNGNDASNVTGVYNAGADTYTFSGLGISVADGGNEVYTVNAYWNDNTGLTEDRTLILSTDGDTDFTVGGSGTQMGATTAVTNGSGSPVDVTATTLAFTTQPSGSVSGNALSTQPVITAEDAFGNTDTDFTETVTLTEASAGSLSGATVATTSGVATFTNVAYTATADQQSFTLTANDQDGVGSDLPTTDANAVTSDVVATRLAFATEPAPTSIVSGASTAFTSVPVVQATDANDVVDTGYSTSIVLSVTDPNDGVIDGTVNSMSVTSGDMDGNGTTVTLSPSSGAATFTGLALQYTNGGLSDDLALRATSGGLTTATSTTITSVNGPTVTDGNIAISGASGTGGAFRIGDTVTATWNNTAFGDKNSGVTGVTVDFSAFGGGVAVAASNDSNTWTATYTITAGALDGTSRNVSVTASNGAASTTTTDGTNATVDNVAPTVTDASLTISGASGTGGAFRVGDTVTATWDDTAGGDDNSDTIAGVTVDFSAFGGGAALAASNSSDTWTATYTLTAGTIDGTGLNVSATATDDAGNTTTTADATNATVDTSIPSAPSTPDLAAASDTGTSNTDDLTADTTPTLTGTAEANSSVAISSDLDGTLDTTTADGSGNWSFMPGSALSEGTHSLTATATDGAGNASSSSVALSVTVDASAPNQPAVPDLTAGSDAGFSTSDDLTDDTTPTLTGTAEANAMVTITSDLDGALGSTAADGSGNWSFTPGPITEAAHDVTLTATDAAGNTSATSAALTLTVTDLAPALVALDGDALAFTEGMEPQALDQSTPTTVTDADNAHYDGGQLIATIVDAVADEGLSLQTSAPLSLDGATVRHNGVAVGSLADAGHTLTVSFNGDATPAVVQDVVRQIAYGNTETAPSTAPRTVHFTLEDGTGYSDAADVSVSVTPVNDAPVIAALEADAIAYGEGDAPVALSATLTVSDPDGDAMQSANVAFSSGYVAGEDGLAFTDQGGISGSFDTATGTLTLTGAASASAYETALRTVVYTNAGGDRPTDGDRTLQVEVSDGALSSAPVARTLTVTAANDAPVASADTATTDEDTTVEITVLANDTDVDEDDLTVTAVTQPANGTAVTNGDGTVTYTPATDFVGSDTFAYTLSDGTLTDEATVTVTVGAVNDAPTVDSTPVTDANEGAAYLYEIAASDVDGDDLTLTASGLPTWLALTDDGDGTATLAGTPPFDAAGTYAITLTATDGALSTPQAFTLTVGDVNQGPVATSDAETTEEDTAVAIAVLANDADLDENALTVTAVSAPEHGTAAINDDGTVTYTPAADYNGGDSFTYTVSDGTLTDEATVTVTVEAINDAPVFTTEAATAATENALYRYEIAATDVEGDDLSIEAGSLPAWLSLVDNGDGTAVLSGTPADGDVGAHPVTLTVSDGALSTPQAFTVTVTDVENAPVAADDEAETEEDTPLAIDVLANDTDADGDALAVTAVSAPEHGTAEVADDGTVLYTPATDYSGTDTFTYTVGDGTGGTDEATVTVTATPVDDAPVAVDDAYETAEDEALTITAPGLLDNDTDVEGRPLTAGLVEAPDNASLDLQADGSFVLTPDADFYGTVSFTYRAVGLGSASAPATVTVEVATVNDVPVATDDAAATDEDTAAEVAVLANDTDVDEDALTVTAVTQPANGTAALGVEGTVRYTPAPAFFGTDSFTYTVSDGNGGTAEATVTLTVNPVNDAPVATDDATTTDEDTAAEIAVLANDTDIDGDALTVADVTQPAHGAVTIETGARHQAQRAPQGGSLGRDAARPQFVRAPQVDRTLTVSRGEGNGVVLRYTPNPEYYGPDSFTYTVSDGNGGTAEATVTLTVTPVNDAPVATGDEAKTEEDTAVAIDVLANDTDVDGDTLVVTAVSAPEHGTAVIADDGTVTYTPPAAFSGADAFTYTVSDGNGGEASATASLIVDPVNDAPVAADDAAETVEDTPLTLDVLANDADVDGDTLTVTAVSTPEHGTAAIEDDGTVTYTPTPDFFGADLIIYTISDGHGGETTAEVDLTVTPVNDAPSAVTITAPADSSSIMLTGSPDAAVTVAWTTGKDADGDAISYRWEATLAPGDFSDPLLSADTDEVSFETTQEALDAALGAAGVGVGGSAVLAHRVVTSDGEAETIGPVATVTLIRGTLTSGEDASLPTVFAANGAYPNPSAGAVRIALDLPWPAEVSVEVYDLAGRRVALRTSARSPGRGQSVSVTDFPLSTGMYLYRLRVTSPTETEMATGRFTVVR